MLSQSSSHHALSWNNIEACQKNNSLSWLLVHSHEARCIITTLYISLTELNEGSCLTLLGFIKASNIGTLVSYKTRWFTEELRSVLKYCMGAESVMFPAFLPGKESFDCVIARGVMFTAFPPGEECFDLVSACMGYNVFHILAGECFECFILSEILASWTRRLLASFVEFWNMIYTIDSI